MSDKNKIDIMEERSSKAQALVPETQSLVPETENLALKNESLTPETKSLTAEMENLSPEMFQRVETIKEEDESNVKKSVSFWKDAGIRLRKNKSAMFALFVLTFIILMAIFAPMASQYSYKEQIQPLRAHSKLPPRIPYIEKLGIFDGTRIAEVGQRRLEKEYKEGDYILLDEYEIIDETGNPAKRFKIKEFTYIKNGIEDEYFIFGTDDLARDLWTRIWRGTRISLYVGLLAAFIDFFIGVSFGAIAGYYGGKVDIIMMRIIEIIAGIPWLVIVLVFILILGNGLVPMSFAIAVSGWTGMARVVRSQFINLRNQEFVLAARTLGASNTSLIVKHILPNVIGQIIVMITFSIPSAIFTEAFLAFIGLGIPAPDASLGSITNESKTFLQFLPSMVFIPAGVLSVLMLSINILANGLRDALDPKMKNL